MAAAGLQVALQANFPQSWFGHTCLSNAVFGGNEDNRLYVHAAVTCYYLCPLQFNTGESACCAGGRDRRRGFFFSPGLLVLRERL